MNTWRTILSWDIQPRIKAVGIHEFVNLARPGDVWVTNVRGKDLDTMFYISSLAGIDIAETPDTEPVVQLRGLLYGFPVEAPDFEDAHRFIKYDLPDGEMYEEAFGVGGKEKETGESIFHRIEQNVEADLVRDWV